MRTRLLLRDVKAADLGSPSVLKLAAAVSLARGLVGLTMPRGFARLAGSRLRPAVTTNAFGVREVVIGAGLHRCARPGRRDGAACWLAARTVGDAFDVGLHVKDAWQGFGHNRRLYASLALAAGAMVVDGTWAMWLGAGAGAPAPSRRSL